MAKQEKQWPRDARQATSGEVNGNTPVMIGINNAMGAIPLGEIKNHIEITGTELEPIASGALTTPLAGQIRTMDVVGGKNGSEWTHPSLPGGKASLTSIEKGRLFFNGSVWRMTNVQELPKPPVKNEYGESTTEPASQKIVTNVRRDIYKSPASLVFNVMKHFYYSSGTGVLTPADWAVCSNKIDISGNTFIDIKTSQGDPITGVRAIFWDVAGNFKASSVITIESRIPVPEGSLTVALNIAISEFSTYKVYPEALIATFRINTEIGGNSIPVLINEAKGVESKIIDVQRDINALKPVNITDNRFNINYAIWGFQITTTTFDITEVTGGRTSAIFRANLLEGDKVALTWTGGESFRQIRWEDKNRNLLRGELTVGREFEAVAPKDCVYICFPAKRPNEEQSPSDLTLRITPNKSVSIIDGKSIEATKVVDNATLGKSGSAKESIVNNERLQQTFAIEGTSLFNISSPIVVGRQVSSSNSDVPYKITSVVNSNLCIVPIVEGQDITVEWIGGESTRYARYDKGDGNTDIIQGFDINNRKYRGISPAGATRLVIGVKRPSETLPMPEGMSIYLNGIKPAVSHIFGLPIKSESFNYTLPYTGYANITDLNINGIPIRIVLPNAYDFKGNASHLMLTAHGNSGNINYGYNAAFTKYARENNIVLALINIQDQVTPPFTTKATGFGNNITVNRMIALYEWCQHYLNVEKSVILQGQSMGGLTVGILAAQKQFPVRFLLQIGCTPDLKYRFENASNDSKAIIRNSFGMKEDGSDDTRLVDFIRGNDWFALNTVNINNVLTKVSFPNTYIYMGNGDTSFAAFGGTTKLLEVRDMIRRGGSRCEYTEVNGVSHGDGTLWNNVLADGIFQKELG